LQRRWQAAARGKLILANGVPLRFPSTKWQVGWIIQRVLAIEYLPRCLDKLPCARITSIRFKGTFSVLAFQLKHP
jgi:hypothetical protein